MIKDYKIVFGTAATNLIKNNYYPISKICIESACRYDFVDEFIILDAGSKDETIEVHKKLSSKVIPIYHEEIWNTENMVGLNDHKAWWDQWGFISRYNKTRAESGEKIIQILITSENIGDKNFEENLYKNCVSMIEKKIDVDVFPVRKAYTKDFSEINFNRRGYRSIGEGMIRFDKEDNALWDGYVADNKRNIKLSGNRNFYHFNQNYKGSGMTNYDNWFFTKSDFLKKCQNHVEWGFDNIQEGFLKKIKGKAKTYGMKKINYRDFYPKDIVDLIEKDLNPIHLGYDYFGMIK